MKASNSVKELIKQAEGLRLKAYYCSSGVPTIGYGHTGSDVRIGMTISSARATELFDEDLARFELGLNALMSKDGVVLTQGQYDALLSFVFNVGLDNLKCSTLWTKVKSDPTDATIPAEFKRWVYGTKNGKKVKLHGLMTRRNTEAQLWIAG